MHLPDGLLDPITLIVLWIIVILVIILGFFKVSKIFQNEDSEKLIPYIGVLAAVIFAFQFVNYPVIGGTSGHLIGGTLVAIILGPWASVIVLFLILVIQSLFGDGGITAIGANAFNMGIIGGIFGFFIVIGIVRLLNHTSLKKEVKVTIGTAIGSYIAIILASLVCGIELGLSGVIPLEIAIPAMVFWHIFIGLGESVISSLIIFYIYKVKPDFITTESILGVKDEKN
ncbi:MAG: energy-coupling factor ABC transporter permease [Promethearchaeota archaeon]|jgi:cobalt/nickel transport system permease protein